MKRDPSPSASFQSSDPEDARKPGRKKSANPATTRTAALSRIRQREFRERKANYVKDLEATVAEQKERIKLLELQISSSSPSSCANCTLLLERIFALEDFNRTVTGNPNSFIYQNVSDDSKSASPYESPSVQIPVQSAGPEYGMREASVQPTPPPIVLPPPPEPAVEDEMMNEWRDVQETRRKNAVELFGPLDIDFTRRAMKMLPSLRNCKYVDELFDLFLVQGRCSEPKTIRKYIVKIVQTRYKLMDACSLLDRQAVIEVWEVFSKRNAKHHEYWNSIMNAPNTSELSPTSVVSSPGQSTGLENEQARLFKQSVKAIPSLQDQETDNIVDELCAIFWTTSLKSERELKIFRMIELSERIMTKCATVEDRTKFIVAAEVARESNRTHMDQLLDHSGDSK
ncbi:hypothetical protein HDU81_004330 [Chytriomyces hyalinus]|nr:hypothetical protein HDU81_004330 [Chytriomyces hyalinus]